MIRVAAPLVVTIAFSGCSKRGETPEPVESADPSLETATPVEPEPVAPAPIVVEDVGFATPESVLYDEQADAYLVSNINGSPLEAAGNGFISRLGPDGTVIELAWIDGTKPDVSLDAPKGMAFLGDTLYVADIIAVRLFDRKTGAARGSIVIKDATFLNDVAAGDDAIYVSDSGLRAGDEGFAPSGTDAIYRIDAAGEVTRLIAGDELGRPNGLHVAGEDVWVVTFGSGELYRVTAEGERTDVQKLPQGSLDGLVAVPGGDLLISSWDAQAVYRGPATGPFEEIVTGVPAPADIGYDSRRNRVLIPLFMDDAVHLHPLD